MRNARSDLISSYGTITTTVFMHRSGTTYMGSKFEPRTSHRSNKDNKEVLA